MVISKLFVSFFGKNANYRWYAGILQSNAGSSDILC